MSKEQYIEFPEEYTRRELNARYREKEIVFSLSPKLVTDVICCERGTRNRP